MSELLRRILTVSAVFSLLALVSSGWQGEPPSKKDIMAAMSKSAAFMMNTVSNRGGFLWHYSEDFTRQWGELPARKSQIWVQPPSTTTVGLALVEAYKATGDPQYLKYADQVAGALIWGQLPSGGWNYFIDFDPSGIRKYYEEVGATAVGWEEFYHYYGNATFDDYTSASAIRFLLRLYVTNLDPKYRPPLLQALNFVLESQYPNGAWPQRYPLRDEFQFEGRRDYTSFFTFNDDVINNNVYLLQEAYEKLGREEYKNAARRGMDFYLVSQLANPQAGWAEQYDREMKPAWARSYEPASVSSYTTVQNIKDLENFYLITGDRRYLKRTSDAIKWLEDSVIRIDPASFTHAFTYELGTNKPLYIHHSHTLGANRTILRFWMDYDYTGEKNYAETNILMTGGGLPKFDLDQIKKEFKRVDSLTSEQARAEYTELRKNDKDLFSQYTGLREFTIPQVDAHEVRRLISAMDERGAWITDVRFLNTLDYIDGPVTAFKGIDTGTYVLNMDKLITYLRTIKDATQH